MYVYADRKGQLSPSCTDQLVVSLDWTFGMSWEYPNIIVLVLRFVGSLQSIGGMSLSLFTLSFFLFAFLVLNRNLVVTGFYSSDRPLGVQ